MASISVPCPKLSVVGLAQRAPLLAGAGSARFPLQQVPNRSTSLVLKAQAQKVAPESSSNSSPVSSTKSEVPSSGGKDAEAAVESNQVALSDSAISTFMAEVSDLVKLVDSRDITELQLKQNGCELIIRKKEAMPQPPAPVIMMQSPQTAYAPQAPLPQAVLPPASAATPAPSAPALSLPPPASKSSLPPLKCPMAGTFYRSPAPGEPSFVKVGDKVKKGQVICIIEAMKLMNEIEADQSGTIVDIIAEDGKPVSVDTPLLIIGP